MNYKQMIKEIDDLVNNDFVAEMSAKECCTKGKFTQKEARQMAEALSNVYQISHCLHCEACGSKYK